MTASQGMRDTRRFWTWLLVTTAVVFSAMGGPMHPYYTVLMAPAIAALTGSGLVDLWRAASVERQRQAGAVLAAVTAGSLVWEAHVAGAGLALVVGACFAVPLAAAAGWVTVGRRRTGAGPSGLGAFLVAMLVVPAMLAGPVAYSLATDTHAVTGANPLGGPDGGQAPAAYPPALVAFLEARGAGQTWAAATPRATAASTLALATRRPVLTLGGFMGSVPFPTLAAVQAWVRLGRVRYLVVSASASELGAPRAARTEATRIVQWGVAHGCRVPLPEREYVVEDLTRQTCAGTEFVATAPATVRRLGR